MAEASVLAAPSVHLADNSRKAIWAAAIGNVLEWYDFGVYAYLAGLIATKFFPSTRSDRLLLAAFAAYRRRLPGAAARRHRDRPHRRHHGRKTALMLTIFLMAVGTVLIGMLPTYAAIGVCGADPAGCAA